MATDFANQALIQQLLRRVENLERQVQSTNLDLGYRLDVMGIKRAWQDSSEGNVDLRTPLVLDIYIPKQTKVIRRAILRLRLMRYRAYVATTVNTLVEGYTEGAYSTGGIAFWTDTAGVHSHYGAVQSDGDHRHGVPDHRHYFRETYAHKHELDYGIVELDKPTNVAISINGTDRTAELGGPFNSDQEELDITHFLAPIGFNTIEFRVPGGLGRIRASIFVELYLP